MRKGNVLPIAIMAFAIVGFFFVMDYSIGGGKWPWSAPSGTTPTLNSTANTSVVVTANVATNTNSAANHNTNSTADPFAGWNSYTNSDLGFGFRYPKEFGVVSFVIANGESGKKFNGTFSNTTLLDFGGINDSFSEGRGGYFLDTQGYVKDGSTYYYKFVNTRRVDIRVEKEIAGVKMTSVLVKGSDENSPSNPGNQAVGAVMNLPSNGQFAGLAIRTLDTKVIPQTTFEEILSTFTFTDPIADWKTYSSATYGYAVRYPTDWSATETSSVVTLQSPTDPKQRVLICPDTIGTDCPPTQDAQYSSASTSGTLAGKTVSIRSYALTSTDCASCAPKMKAYNFMTRPVGWRGSSDVSVNRDVVSRSDSDGSFMMNDRILSTLTFTK